MIPNYAHALLGASTRCNARTSRAIDQSVLLNHAQQSGGMNALLAQANRNGICAALTVQFVEAAILGTLGTFNQSSLAQNQSLSRALRSHFGSSFFALHSGTPGNFELAASHMQPQKIPVAAVVPTNAFMVAMKDAIALAAGSIGNTVAVDMSNGTEGHVVGFKIIPGGTCSFFDANAGLYQFDRLDDLRAFWRAAYEIAGYTFTRFNVVTFHKAPAFPH